MAKRAEATQSAAPRGGAQRPSFAKRYPASTVLDEVLASFQAGDHGDARRRAAALARNSQDPEVRRAAEDVLRRLRPGRVATYLFLLPVGLLLLLLAHYVL